MSTLGPVRRAPNDRAVDYIIDLETTVALLLHGQRSTLLSTEMAHQMVRRRPRTQLVEFPNAGHWIHDDDPAGCATAILNFLSKHSDSV